MATDIHVYIEYDEGKDLPFTVLGNINALSDGEFLVPRDYRLFVALSGVRSSDDFQPMYPPRGMPKIASTDAINAFYFNILDDENERLKEEDVLRLQAESWLEGGLSQITDSWIKQDGFVSNPDYHTPSWLYLAEIKLAFTHSPFQIQDMPKEMLIILDLLESIERYYGIDRARIVFWFDN